MTESTIHNRTPAAADVSHDTLHATTQRIEHSAADNLHDASHAKSDHNFHELLAHVAQNNAAEQTRHHPSLPVVQLTTSADKEGLQIDNAKPAPRICDDDGSTETKPKADDKPASSTSKGQEGVFYFYEEVNKPSVLRLTQLMETWAKDPSNKDQPVRIVMNSPGGSIFDGFSLMDEIAHLRRDGHRVKIEDYGMAASAAGWIMQAADTRSIGANSWMLIHEPSSEVSGKLSSMVDDVHVSEQLENQFLQLFADRSKLSVNEIRKHIDGGRDWWIPAQTAKALGLVDEVEAVPVYQPLTPHHS